MPTILETPQSMKSHEPLEKVFNVLFTPTMYADIESQSMQLRISKGALIRSAVETYLRRMDAEQS
jgi:hypothetical protein